MSAIIAIGDKAEGRKTMKTQDLCPRTRHCNEKLLEIPSAIILHPTKWLGGIKLWPLFYRIRWPLGLRVRREKPRVRLLSHLLAHTTTFITENT